MSIPKLKEEINLDMDNFLNGSLDKIIQNFTNLRARTGGDASVVYDSDYPTLFVTYNPSGTRR